MQGWGPPGDDTVFQFVLNCANLVGCGLQACLLHLWCEVTRPWVAGTGGRAGMQPAAADLVVRCVHITTLRGKQLAGVVFLFVLELRICKTSLQRLQRRTCCGR
jgi:hypothetical protein